jgi:hypothetical protein
LGNEPVRKGGNMDGITEAPLTLDNLLAIGIPAPQAEYALAVSALLQAAAAARFKNGS